MKVDDVWKPVCNNVAVGNSCSLGNIARDKEVLDIRLENYAREGESQWSVDEVSIFDSNVNGLSMPNFGVATPIPTNIRPINPPNGRNILPSPLISNEPSEE